MRGRSTITLAGTLALLLSGCGHPGASRGAAPVPLAPDAGVEGGAPRDAEESALQQERLAAIQKAMNELDEGAQGCWAAAATERFDIEGDVEMRIEVGIERSVATAVRDTTRNAKLARCLVELFAGYHWAPPLYGQTIQLPFKFRAPDGQSVVDRALVPWAGQAGRSVAVLLDEANTANDEASMFELALDAGVSTGLRFAERAELWYFLGPATVVDASGKRRTAVGAGDLVTIPAGSAREVIATAGAVHAVVVVTPGGQEGAARAGAMPMPELDSTRRPVATPVVSHAGTASGAGFEAAVVTVAAGNAIGGTHVKTPVFFYVLGGTATLEVGTVKLAVTGTSAIQVPALADYALRATTTMRALRVSVTPHR